MSDAPFRGGVSVTPLRWVKHEAALPELTPIKHASHSLREDPVDIETASVQVHAAETVGFVAVETIMTILSICLNPAIDISAEATDVKPSRKNRTRHTREDPGGGGVNVARVLSSFGLPVRLLYTSGGTTGLLLDTLLTATGIDCQCVPIRESTRICCNYHDVASNLEYRFVAEGPVVTAGEMQSLLQTIGEIPLIAGDYVIASGSLPRGAAVSLYAEIASRAAQCNARFILDTSGPALQEALAGAPVFMIKPSLGELSRLAGYALDESNASTAARQLVDQGKVVHVIVSMAGQGALLVNADGVQRVAALEVPVASAVGAGDTFLAGIVARLVEGSSVNEAFEYGVAAGAAAVMTPGSLLSSKQEIDVLWDERVRRSSC